MATIGGKPKLRAGHLWSRSRGGMTLIEVLVAMSVLLVGIWGVARGFPMLMRTVREEGRRTQMTRLAQAAQQMLSTDPAGVPMMVSGGPNIAPQMVPEDPDSFDASFNPPNSRDDLMHVLRERAVVPSLPAGSPLGTPATYAFKLGRANTALDAVSGSPVNLAVSAVSELTALPTAPVTAMPAGCFYLQPDGTIDADPAVTQMEISYAWLDQAGATHWVQREQVAVTGTSTVAAGGPGNTTNFKAIVEGSSWGSSLANLTVLGGVGATPSNPGEVALDATGAVLKFNAADSGRTVQITYDLQTDSQTDNGITSTRRARELFEDQVLSDAAATTDAAAPSDPPGTTFSLVTVQLTADGLRDDWVLNTDPAALDTRVLAVDLVTGTPYYEGVGLGIDPDTGIDFDKGKVTLRVPNGPIGARALGHTFRFFYRTVDDGMLTVIRAPEYYLPADLFGPNSDRQFAVQPANANGYTVLDFTTGSDPMTADPLSASAGATVWVDYTYGDPASPQRVSGEQHTINIAERQITLNQPNVQSVIAVRGASLTVRAWWRSATGRLLFQDIDNLVSPTPAA